MIVVSLLQKVLVNHFYKVNAGLFLFIFFVLFGLPNEPLLFHLSIINGIISSYTFLMVVFVMWFIYALKITDYILKHLHEQEQSFLFCMVHLPKNKLFINLLYVQIAAYLPVLLYVFAIIFVALQKGILIVAIAVILFNLAIIVFSTLIFCRAILRILTIKSSLQFPGIFIHLPKSLALYPLLFLWFKRKQMLFFSKLFSILTLYIFIQTYEPDHYDLRPLQLCFLLIAIAQAALIYQLREFEVSYLSFCRNLPINSATRFMHLVLMYFVLMFPELVLLLKGNGLHFIISDFPGLVLILLALTTFYHITLLIEHVTMEDFIQRLFVISAVCFFIILYNPGTYFAAALMLIAFALFSTYYYAFEKNHDS